MKLQKRTKPIPEYEALGKALNNFWRELLAALRIEQALDWLAAWLERRKR